MPPREACVVHGQSIILHAVDVRPGHALTDELLALLGVAGACRVMMFFGQIMFVVLRDLLPLSD